MQIYGVVPIYCTPPGAREVAVKTVDWADFKIMLALSRGGSLAGAARELGVDSSTVSRRLAELEHDLDATLVVRGGRDFKFTPEGELALAAAQEMFRAAKLAQRKIQAARVELSGRLRISIPPLLTQTMSPFRDTLASVHPELSLEFLGSTQIANISVGETDIAVRMVPPSEPGLIARKAFDLGWCLYASESYLNRNGWPKQPEDLEHHRLVLYTLDKHHLPHMSWLETFNREELPMRTSCVAVAFQLALAGQGIAGLPAFAFADDTSGMRRVFPRPYASHQVYVVYHESQKDTARTRLVVDELLQFFGERAEQLSGRLVPPMQLSA